MIKNRLSVLLILMAIIVAVCCTNTGIAFANVSTGAQGAILMEKTSGRVMYEQNAHKRLPMASTTKIFTALTIINNCNLEDVVTVDKRAVGIEGSSIYLQAGEHLTVLELLYGLMLQSGNDCAVALAIHCSGGVEQFADTVNQLCSKYQLKDTNIVTPHGLHDDNHYTSAYDLAKITCIALQNETFAKIVSTKSIKIAHEGYDYMRVIVNKNKLLSRYEFGDGVKTGYTKKAGRCFVGSATKDGMQLVAVVLNCGPMFEDSQALLTYGFSKYTMTNIVSQNKVYSVNFDGKCKIYYCPVQLSYPIDTSTNEADNISTTLNLSDTIPIVEVMLGKQLIFSQKLVTI